MKNSVNFCEPCLSILLCQAVHGIHTTFCQAVHCIHTMLCQDPDDLTHVISLVNWPKYV